LKILPHPTDPTKIAVYFIAQQPPYVQDPVTKRWGGVQQRFICAGESHMPEWSLMSTEEQTLPHNTRHAETEMIKEQVPWSEEKRGWRTVLYLLLYAKLLTLPQVEALIDKHGSSNDSKQWNEKVYGGKVHA